MSKKEILKEVRKKLIISSLACSLAVTAGCSLMDKDKEESEKKLYIQTPDMFDELDQSNEEVDNQFNLKNYDESSALLNLDYLLDTSFLTDEDYERLKKETTGIEKNEKPMVTFAHLVDEKVLTNTIGVNTKENDKNSTNISNIVLWPDELSDYEIPKEYMKTKVRIQKLKTMDYRTIYSVNSNIEFTNGVEKVVPLLNENDYMSCNCVYEMINDKLIEIYRYQTGAYSDSFNIESINYHSTPILTKVDNTIFNKLSGTYDEAYLAEVADTYAGTDNYYESKNDEFDFEKFKKRNILK